MTRTKPQPKEWEEMTFGEAVAVNPPAPLPRGEEATFVGMDGIAPFTKKVAQTERRTYKGGGAKFQNSDTLVARITPSLENGKTAFVDILDDGQVGFGSTEFIVLRALERLSEPQFVYYFATSPRFRNVAIGSMTGTSGRQRVQTDLLANTIFALPEPDEQREIAGVLAGLDDKIELLRKQNETLETIAKAVFHEWFVAFNFPNENGEPYKASGGKMAESELGEIPEGWGVGELGDFTKIVYGKNLPTKNLKGSGYPVFGGNGLIGFYDEFLYKKPQVTVACRGEASGRVNITLPHSFITNNSLVLEILENNDLNFSFLKHWSIAKEYYGYVTGSAQPQITIQSIKQAPILLPKKVVMQEFDAIVAPFEERRIANRSQIDTLRETRDTLLPKLMGGEIRVNV